jgi:hypothetical protein
MAWHRIGTTQSFAMPGYASRCQLAIDQHSDIEAPTDTDRDRPTQSDTDTHIICSKKSSVLV